MATGTDRAIAAFQIALNDCSRMPAIGGSDSATSGTLISPIETVKFMKLNYTSLLLTLSAIALVSSCSSRSVETPTPAAIVPSASPVAANPNSIIGRIDSTGTVIKVDTPNDPICHRKYQSVKQDNFKLCLVEGLTFVQVSNVFGHAGELQSSSGTTEIYQWNDGAGKYATALFISGYLSTKSQVGLEPTELPL